MVNYSTLSDLFTGIADAIRAKNGGTEVIVADNFPTEIQNLKTGFDYNNHNVITIPDYGFKNCTNLRSVDCYSLTSVGTSAFENCKSLKTVILYDGVTEVNENAFKGCEGLTIYCYFDKQPDTWNESWNPDNCEVIWLGGAVQTWDISATSEDSVTAKLYSNVQNNGTYSLIISGNGNMEDYNWMHSPPYYDYKSNILNVIIHNVTRIGDNAFSNCINLMNVSISNTVASIGEAAFN